MKSCLEAGSPAEFTLFNWTVRDSDGGRYEAQSYQPGAIPGPDYGVNRLAPDRCVRGWIPFEVDDASAIKAAVYAPYTGHYAEWRLHE